MPPVHLLIKPASGICNLRCRYCFYADVTQNRETESYGIMSPQTLEQVILRAFDYATGEVTFAFQGGEPTMAGLPFFRLVVELAKKHNTKRLGIHYAIQTNGIVVDDEWAQFFATNQFLVGLSLDGNKDTHDLYRVDPQGKGTYKTVMHTAQMLDKYRVEYNILTVITAQTAKSIGKIYGFYKNNNFRYQQFIPCLDPLGEERGQHPYSLTAEGYAYFLKTLFDLWYQDIVRGQFAYNRYFENLVGMLLGYPPESCGMSGHCTKQLVVEADGGVYPCDFYVLDCYKLGNLNTDSLEVIEENRDKLGFIQQSMQTEEKCAGCRWFSLCRGGCRRDRDRMDGSLGVSCYCESYQAFFEYAYERLQKVARMVKERNEQ